MIKRKIPKIGMLLLGLILIQLMFLPKVKAVDEEELVKQVGFTYQVNYPSNQQGQGGALKLMMESDQKQDVSIELTNSSDREIVLELSVSGARTNSKGGLEYGPSKFKASSSMKYDLPDLVSVPETVTIPEHTTKEVNISIQMPKIAYDGIVTGGLRIMEANQESKTANDGAMIVNKTAYLIGITLKMNDNEVEPELVLERAYPELANYRSAIFLDISNLKSRRMLDMFLDISITEKNKRDVLYQTKQTNLKMAPDSLMSYPVSLAGEKMKAGKYTAYVTARVGEDEWNWNEDFTITKDEADKFNQLDVSLIQEPGINYKLIIIAVALISLVIGLVYFFFFKKKSHKKSRTKRKKKIKQNLKEYK